MEIPPHAMLIWYDHKTDSIVAKPPEKLAGALYFGTSQDAIKQLIRQLMTVAPMPTLKGFIVKRPKDAPFVLSAEQAERIVTLVPAKRKGEPLYSDLLDIVDNLIAED